MVDWSTQGGMTESPIFLIRASLPCARAFGSSERILFFSFSSTRGVTLGYPCLTPPAFLSLCALRLDFLCVALSEVKIYNRGAPGCVLAEANATRRAFAPFDGDFDFAMRCCLSEARLGVRIGVLTRLHLSLWVIKNDSRPPVGEVEL